MAATSSVSGLVSGLDTASIISQLMQVEAQPQTLLKTQMSTKQTSISALQDINSKFASLASKAHDLATAASWSPFTTTSSSADVTVNAGSGATPATITVTVNKVGTPSTIDFGPHSLGDKIVNGTSTVYMHPTSGSGPDEKLDTGDGTVQGLVNAINASKSLRATLVQVKSGSYHLMVTSTATGASSAFELTDGTNPIALTGTAAGLLQTGSSTTGTGAEIIVGSDTIDQDSNTFTNLMPGVDVTIGAQAKGDVTISVAQDAKTAAAAAQSLVDVANDILSAIDKQTSYDSTNKTSGPLAGDSTLRSLRSQVLDTVTNAADGRSLASVGIQLDRSGKITFNQDTFNSAYAANPANVASLLGDSSQWTGSGNPSLVAATWRTQPGIHAIDFDASANPVSSTIDGGGTLSGSLLSGASGSSADGLVVNVGSGAVGTFNYYPGFAARLEAMAQQASDAYQGTLTTDIQGRQSSVSNMQDAISDWDVRLAAKQDALQQQFSAMEVALGKLQNQASWLSGQIASLPTTSSGA